MGLLEFIERSWHVIIPEQKYIPGKHIAFIARHLEAITYGVFKAKGLENRLLANVPPGSMKSLLITVFWPAWEWGPAGLNHLQYLCTSFREDFCRRDSGRFIKIVTSEWFQKRWPIEITKQTEMHIENVRGGWRAGVPFGSLTGGRADRLLIDDPHSVEKAESDVDRAKTVLRFRDSATSRLNDPTNSAIIVIMQRLHQHDIAGTILQLHLPYVHINIPMRFEAGMKDGKPLRCETPLGQDWRVEEGDLYWPERFPEEVVARDEAAMTAVAVAGQHQQRPVPRGGALFKRHWFGFVPAAPAGCLWVRGWDLAASVKKTSPFTSGVKLGYDPGSRRFYVGHVVRDRVENPEQMIINTARADGPGVIQDLPQDPGAAGKVQARSLVAAVGLAGLEAHASPESGEKVQRAKPFSAQAEVGNVLLVEGPWNNDYLDEIETAPSGYMDQIDATSRAFARFVMQNQGMNVKPVIGGAAPQHFFGDNIVGGELSNPALGDGVGVSGNGSSGGLEHLGIRSR